MRIRDYRRQWDIGDSIYTIRFVRYQEEDVERTGIVYGMNDPCDKELLITLGQTPRERLKSVIHEMFEAMIDEYDLKIPHKAIEDLEEPLARFLEDNHLAPKCR